jgi:hypothetical protein
MAENPPEDHERPVSDSEEDHRRFFEHYMGRYKEWKPYLWQGKIGPAFWTIAGLFSLGLNVILIIMLITLGREFFGLKSLLDEQLVGGLYENFVRMDEAVIETTIPVDDSIPVQFDLPVSTSTVVTLTEDTLLENARVDLVTGGLRITDAPTEIILKEGTVLPVNLNMVVPVDTSIPIHLDVAVKIPLKDTELHEPFVGLQDVVAPYGQLLGEAPDSWGEALCPAGTGFFCLFADH